MSYHSLLPQNWQSLLHSVDSTGDLAEVVLTERFLIASKRAMIRPCQLQVSAVTSPSSSFNIRSCCTVDTFKRHLKNHLFRQSWPDATNASVSLDFRALYKCCYYYHHHQYHHQQQQHLYHHALCGRCRLITEKEWYWHYTEQYKAQGNRDNSLKNCQTWAFQNFARYFSRSLQELISLAVLLTST